MTREPLPDRRTCSVLLGAKVLLVPLMVVGAVFLEVGGFDGKGMGYRLPVYVIPALIVPLRWWRGRAWDPGLDIGLPCRSSSTPSATHLVSSTAGRASTNMLHFLNWFVLVWGVTKSLDGNENRRNQRGLLWIAGTGLGAIAAIAWEIAEYNIMQAGVGNLPLTYADTLVDPAAGSIGGAIGAALAVSVTARWWQGTAGRA